jgi:Tir chaperone protein (CesT) family
METDRRLALLLDELGEYLQLDTLALDEEGLAALSFDGRTVVNLVSRPDLEELWFVSDLGVPAGGPAVYGELLAGNRFWRRTRGATLALTEDEPASVTLTLPISWPGLDGAQLARKLEDFVQTAQAWATALAEEPEVDDEDDDDGPEDAPADPSSLIRV